MSLRAQFAAVGIVAVLVEGVLGALVLASEGPSRIAVFLILCAVATTILTAGVVWALGLPPRDDGRGDDGGGPGDQPPSPPPWWPEFEDGFRAYARERDHRIRSPR